MEKHFTSFYVLHDEVQVFRILESCEKIDYEGAVNFKQKIFLVFCVFNLFCLDNLFFFQDLYRYMNTGFVVLCEAHSQQRVFPFSSSFLSFSSFSSSFFFFFFLFLFSLFFLSFFTFITPTK